jgi:acetolactate synthase-1/2/3 large subunit
MGIALPGAIAAKLVYPNKKVMAICGDGGFLMNSQELETALRLKTPFVSLIMSDSGYGLIQWKQMIHFKREAYVDFRNPDFVTLAKSFGAAGYKVNKTEELVPILKEALGQKVPAIIDCPVDYRENLHLTNKLGKMTCPI